MFVPTLGGICVKSWQNRSKEVNRPHGTSWNCSAKIPEFRVDPMLENLTVHKYIGDNPNLSFFSQLFIGF